MTRMPVDNARAKRTLALIGVAVIAPVVLSYAIYYLLPRESSTNYGELLPTRAIASLTGTRADGTAFRLDDMKGKWTIVLAAAGACRGDCPQMLYATRQARTMQGPGSERVERVWLVTDGAAPDRATLAEHAGVVVAYVSPAAIDALPKGANAIYLIDPLGNQVLAWPRDPDIKALSRDLARLLKASRIG